MAIWDPDRKDSTDADVEGIDEGYDAGPVDEETHFLPMDLLPDDVPSKPTSRWVILMCVQFLFMIEFSLFLMDPPQQQIVEDFVCYGRYPDHLTGAPHVPDSRCKNADVQQTLAMVRSWMMWVGMLIRRSPGRWLSVPWLMWTLQLCSYRFPTASWQTSTAAASSYFLDFSALCSRQHGI